MKWGHPPLIKIYEALGAVADGRVHVEGDGAKVYSSSGNKFYTVTYDAATAAVMVNDNGSFYKGYLGYPAVAYLMQVGELAYKPEAAEMLKGIAWKDINQQYKNDFDKTLVHILAPLSSEDREALETEVARLDAVLREKEYSLLGPKVRPPEGY